MHNNHWLPCTWILHLVHSFSTNVTCFNCADALSLRFNFAKVFSDCDSSNELIVAAVLPIPTKYRQNKKIYGVLLILAINRKARRKVWVHTKDHKIKWFDFENGFGAETTLALDAIHHLQSESKAIGIISMKLDKSTKEGRNPQAQSQICIP